jgi:MoxR-like ATPase
MSFSTASPSADLRERLPDVGRAAARLREEVSRRIVGLEETVEQVLIAIFSEHHALLEGVPGLAKTMLISSVAGLLDCEFRRIQFTPDLMPSDVTGTEVLAQDAGGTREFRFLPGPIFAHVILADEINRSPPKTQAALMEAMEERQVTSLGVRRPLERPFFVLATQNPIEQQGTYPLPVAQLDRFMMKVRLGYPTKDDEAAIVRRTTSLLEPPPLRPVLTRAELLGFQATVAHLDVPVELVRYAVDLARASRPASELAPKAVKDYVSWGVGPRAAQALIAGAKARALLRGRVAADFDDVRALVPAVFRHRLITSFAAEADGVTPDDVSKALLDTVPYPGKRPPRNDATRLKRFFRWLVAAPPPTA